MRSPRDLATLPSDTHAATPRLAAPAIDVGFALFPGGRVDMAVAASRHATARGSCRRTIAAARVRGAEVALLARGGIGVTVAAGSDMAALGAGAVAVEVLVSAVPRSHSSPAEVLA